MGLHIDPIMFSEIREEILAHEACGLGLSRTLWLRLVLVAVSLEKDQPRLCQHLWLDSFAVSLEKDQPRVLSCAPATQARRNVHTEFT